ncbi:MAG: thermonuclease family protein [Nanoarchaeota archaeon]
MRRNEIKFTLILILVISSGIFYYKISDKEINLNQAQVIKVIDGDTIETNIGKIRLLGINSPEKSMPNYNEAKIFLNNLLNNETIKVETIHGNEIDKYSRILGHVYLDEVYINKEIIKNGFANLYYYEKDSHYNELKEAEEFAIKNNLGIWKKSNNFGCLKLIKLKFKENKQCNNEEVLVLNNTCQKLKVLIKDNANHIFKEDINSGIFSKNFSCVWNDEGDRILIWDDNGRVFVYSF